MNPPGKGFADQTLQAPVPTVWIEFTPMQALYRHRQQQNTLTIQVNEGLIVADGHLMNQLGQQIIHGKSAKRTQTIRQFSNSEEFREVLLSMDVFLGERPEKAQGRIYNLEHLFDQLNQSYFEGKLSKPTLAWSQSFTHRKFGHYCRSRDQIMLSQTLDDINVSKSVVAFVMYHEMLHIKHGTEWKNGKLWVHTPAFRREERQFTHYEEAEQELQNISTNMA